MGERTDAPARAVAEGLREMLREKVTKRLEWEAGKRTCSHVDLRDPWLLQSLGYEVGFGVYAVLEGTSAKARDLRDSLRDALRIMEAYDVVRDEIHELAAAVRKREVYNVVRRAAHLLEQLDAGDVAAHLLEYAEQHEPVGDGAAFSRIRRRKSELSR